jgi:sialate O-acetylesterase
VCSPDTAADFSAMGYFFARDLLNEIKQPVGILTSSVGGTPIEAWISLSAQQNVPELKPLLEDWTKRLTGFVPEAEQKKFFTAKEAWLKQRSAALKAKMPVPKAPLPFKNLQVMKPGGLFASMIAPLMPYTLRGVIWYQGERNAAGPFSPLYGLQLQTLIADWRARWNDEFHFAYVQLPVVKGMQKLPSEPKGWGVAVRDGQRRTLGVPHTSMAITMDLGGELNGHPANKTDYAKRLSTIVLHDVYQKAIALPTGPLFKSAQAENGKMIITFDYADGLKAKAGELEGFAIAGADGKFVWANAKIEDGKVIVWHDKIAEPKTVHYAFAGNPKGNLVNGAGIPASPFSTE